VCGCVSLSLSLCLVCAYASAEELTWRWCVVYSTRGHGAVEFLFAIVSGLVRAESLDYVAEM
jgi:hypothetical protein